MASKRPSNDELKRRLSEYDEIVRALRRDGAIGDGGIEAVLLRVMEMEENLRLSEERYRELLSNITEAFALHEIVLDERGAPSDCRFLDVNPAFEKLTGMSRANVIGRTLGEVIPNAEPFWVEAYGKVALSGEPARFESYSGPLGRHYEVLAYRTAPLQFAAIFTDVTERKRTGDMIRSGVEDLTSARAETYAQKQQLEAVMEALPVGIAIMDGRGGVVSANAAFDAVWGGTRPDVQSVEDYGPYRAWWVETGKPVAPEEWASAQAIRDGRSVTRQLLEIQRFDGTRAFILNSAAPIRDPEGSIVGGAVAIQDITELRRAEEAVRASEERFNLALLGTQEGVWDWDVETSSVYYSPRWKEMLGYADEDIEPSASALERLIHPDDLARVRALVDSIMRGEREYRIEYRVLHKDGRYLDVLSRGIAVRRKEDGRITRIVGTHLDLTEQKIQERRIARLSSLYSVLSRVNEAIVRVHDESVLLQDVCRIVAEDGRFPLVWIGLVEGRRVVPIASSGTERGYLEEIRVEVDGELGAGPTGTCVRENRSVINDDFHTNVSVSSWREPAARHGFRASGAFPLCRGGRPVGVLSLYSKEPDAFDSEQVLLLESLSADLSYALDAMEGERLRGRAEEALMRAKEELEDRVRERTRELETLNVELETRARELRTLASELTLAEERERRRVAQILHDNLQQYLVAARYRVGALKKRVGEEPLSSEADRIWELIGESIAASRMLTVELSPPILHEAGLSAGLLWLSEWMKETHGLDVEVDVEEPVGSLPEELRFLLFRAVRELLFNVVKHSGVDRAAVKVRRRAEGAIDLVVEDQGKGLSTKAIAPEAAAGSLGLSSIRRRLSLFDARMEIESEPGAGTRVTITAPAAPREVRERVTPLGEAVRRVVRKRAAPGVIRVLIADGHEVMRKGLVGLLESQKDIVIVGEARDGRQALQEARRLKPHVVVMDACAPEMGAVDSTRFMKTEMPGMGVVGICTHCEEAVASRMLAAGADRCLGAECPVQDLLAAIRSVKR